MSAHRPAHGVHLDDAEFKRFIELCNSAKQQGFILRRSEDTKATTARFQIRVQGSTRDVLYMHDQLDAIRDWLEA